MGCSASRDEEVATVDLKAMASGAQATLSKQEVLRRCRERMTATFGPRSERMLKGGISREQMREKLPELNDDVFGFIWHLFDPSFEGTVDIEHFTSGLSLLLQPTGGSLENRLEEMFIMFDMDDSGTLSKAEFKSMVEATVLLNLSRLLATGEKYIEAQMAEEFSTENLAFWHAARDFREKVGEEERAAEAKKIMERFILDGVDEEINLPSLLKSKLLQDWAVSLSGADRTPPVNLFADAENEIFMLMERDTFKRFKENPRGAAAIIDDFFQQADKHHDDVITFEEFCDFAMSYPQIVYAFSQLTETVSHLLSNLDTHNRNSLAVLLENPARLQAGAFPSQACLCPPSDVQLHPAGKSQGQGDDAQTIDARSTADSCTSTSIASVGAPNQFL